MDGDSGDAFDPFTDGLETVSNSHAILAPVGSNRNAGINWDNATSRYRKNRQVGKVPWIVTFLLLISSCANLNPLQVSWVSGSTHFNKTSSHAQAGPWTADKRHPNIVSNRIPLVGRIYFAHMLAYTPWICASRTLSGSGSSHRSGFHSAASGPQIDGSRFKL